MAFFKMVGGALESAGTAVAAGAQLGLNKDANAAMRKAAERTAQNATTVGLDVAGFATSSVAPAIQTAGHCVAAGACVTADVVTLGQMSELRSAREDQVARMERSSRQAAAGAARLLSRSTEWFNDGPNSRGPWMQNLSDDALVKDLFLPGTHDTCAKYGGDFAECQSWTLEEQLEAGIRCFDIRLRQVGDALCVHHGIIYQRRNFCSVVEAMESFVRANPSETLFVSVTGNGCQHHDVKMPFGEQVGRALATPAMWLRPGRLSNRRLGGLRGKIVFLDHVDGDWQNEWECGDADRKGALVLEHGRKDRSPNSVYTNCLNAVGQDGISYMTPAAMAAQVNKTAHDEMHSFRPSIFMMDYPGTGLIRRIIERNFR